MTRSSAADFFLETEAIKLSGGRAEQEVWQAVKAAFAGRECFGYWRYPVFSKTGETRKEPDILLVDRELGLVVIEVKGIKLHNLERVHGHRWQYRDFYEPYGFPYQQAENQLYQLLGYCDAEPLLRRRMRARALVALPYVTREEWEGRGLDRLPSSPPVLFRDDLKRVAEAVAETPPVQSGSLLDEAAWELLQLVVAGTVLFRKGLPPDKPLRGRAEAVYQAREHLHRLDVQQEQIGKQVPPGPQRIRGIAGSGKTVLICQKAALMHLKHPDWDIAVVFFTQSLYDAYQRGIDQWVRRYTGGSQSYDPQNSRVKVLHAWGSRNKPGLYRLLAQKHGVPFITVGHIPEAERGSPLQNYAWALRHLLTTLKERGQKIQPMFDAILVDEGQDLVFDKEYRFEGKQPFYWLAYQSLRPVRAAQEGLLEPDPTERPDLRRLIWAYDEAQSLDSLLIPTARELFGEELGDLVSGQYLGSIKRSEVMHRCYRTPEPILVAAHALGMGLLRPEGMLAGITTQEGWRSIGYEVEGQFIPGREVILTRPRENTPNPVPDLWPGRVLTFSAHDSRFSEAEALAEHLKHDLAEGFSPSRDLLVVLLAPPHRWNAVAQLLGRSLNARGIDFYVPAATGINSLEKGEDPSRFWQEGAVTLTPVARAKGNEAEVVYVAGLDYTAEREGDLEARNALFVALTRARAFAHLSGVGDPPFFEEVRQVLASGSSFRFTFRRPKRELDDENG